MMLKQTAKLWRMLITIGDYNLADGTTKSWECVDCGVNTAPGFPTENEILKLFDEGKAALAEITTDSEIFMVGHDLWKNTKMEPWGGCLCVRCMEARIGRRLKPDDFTGHTFNTAPGTPRLLKRRKR
jgi:hypothetical protein